MAFKIREHQGNTKGPCKLREARVECKLWNGTLWRKAAVFACRGDSMWHEIEKPFRKKKTVNYSKLSKRETKRETNWETYSAYLRWNNHWIWPSWSWIFSWTWLIRQDQALLYRSFYRCWFKSWRCQCRGELILWWLSVCSWRSKPGSI